VYRKASDFCKLILYSATLLKLCMVSRSFWVEFFGSLRYRVMSSANRDVLTVSLPVCIPFTSCLIALARSNKSRCGKSGHPCLVPDFMGNAFSFSPFSMMLAVGLSFIAFIIQQYQFLILLCIYMYEILHVSVAIYLSVF
jgi:hypothetical protein